MYVEYEQGEPHLKSEPCQNWKGSRFYFVERSAQLTRSLLGSVIVATQNTLK